MFGRKLNRITIALLLVASMIFDVFTVENNCVEAVTKPAVTYVFSNKKAGFAQGKITLNNIGAKSVKLYWCDAKGKKLKRNGVEYSEFATVKLHNGSAEYEVKNAYTAIPKGAERLKVYSGNKAVCSYSIPENKKFPGVEKKYSVGLFSDVHFNRYVKDEKDYAVSAFNKCLAFFENKAKVTFAGGCGDISSYSEVDAYEKYAKAADKRSFPCFTCTGNHDIFNDYYWVENVCKDVFNGTKGILNVSSDKLSFVYRPVNTKKEVFIFLSQDYFPMAGVKSRVMKKSTVKWLEKMLKKYSDKRVYLFFHTYIASAKTEADTVGNLLAPNGYSYELTYPKGVSDEKKLKKLLKKYDNVTMFSGHSHWAYSMQKYNSNLNIGSYKDGATLVHVSSVGSPRAVVDEFGNYTMKSIFPELGGNARVERAGLQSEAMVLDVYKRYSVYTGVDVKNGRYLAYATYMEK